MSLSMRRYRRQTRRLARADTARRRSTAPALLVLLAACALGLAWYKGLLPENLGLPVPRALVAVEGRLVAVPAPVADGVRPLPPVAVATSGSYAFLDQTSTGDPVGFDPCRPIRYVVRPDGAPTGSDTLISEAVATISGATGLSFVDAGYTTEEPDLDRPLVQDRYGPGWVPVLFAWSDDRAAPELAGTTAGLGGSSVVPAATGGGTFLAGGRVLLDAPDLQVVLGGPDGYERARAIVVHELAHVVGLDHVDDPNELMAPVTGARTDLGPGDLAGLAAVGAIACDGS